MSARVYFMKRVKDCKDTLIQITAFSVGITKLNQRII